jgi:nucleoside-diphosphate-sugar epimerase
MAENPFVRSNRDLPHRTSAGHYVQLALIRKIHEATTSGAREVVFWGAGRPRHAFSYSDDLADACAFSMGLPEEQYTSLLDLGTTAASAASLSLINVKE